LELIGWTYEKLVNPSKLSTSLPGLRKLLDALNDGTCKFIKLTTAQLLQHCQDHKKAIKDGSLPAPKKRQPRKDIGTKRPRATDDKENEAPASKKSRCAVSKSKSTIQEVEPKSKEVVGSDLETDIK
ncbi:hypothetical protein CVT25_001093, partial [Psilocybe cyanescens]